MQSSLNKKFLLIESRKEKWVYKIHIYFAYLYNNRESKKEENRRNGLKLTPLNDDLIIGPIRDW